MTEEQIKTSRLIENAIEIADGNLPKLQDHFEKQMGRGSIIENYIVPWAYEAERLWEESSGCNREKDYYVFIDNFALRKMSELLQLP